MAHACTRPRDCITIVIMKQLFQRGIARNLGNATPSIGNRLYGELPATYNQSRKMQPVLTLCTFVAAAMAVMLMAVLNQLAHESRLQAVADIRNVNATTEELRKIMEGLKDAETGQRGFLLTNDESYLDPYDKARIALTSHFLAAKRLLKDDELQFDRVEQLELLSREKMAELRETIALQRAGGDAQALVQSDRGKRAMERFREVYATLIETQRSKLESGRAQWTNITNRVLNFNFASALVLLVLIAGSAISAGRDHRLRNREYWIRKSQLLVTSQMQGDQRVEQLGESVITVLAKLLDAQIGVFHVNNAQGRLEGVASYALHTEPHPLSSMESSGLVKQAGKELVPMHIRNLPNGYLNVTSGVGSSAPQELLLIPTSLNGRLQAVIELGFMRHIGQAELLLANSLNENIAMGVRAAKDRSRLEELLEETRQQAAQLQTQQEELRVGNEELEEQSRTLRESQRQLEEQHLKLEQSNEKLGHQAHELSLQRDQLSQAREALALRATELERVSQYKSEFLANISHELRTPLNCTLILSKLLADNKTGNLSPDQVQYALTISAAGNDLLNLINDILDLSKIEAGKVELDLQAMPIAELVESLQQTFAPLADERELSLAFEIKPDAPSSIITDVQRCGQILKNLLSNAIKFTSTGGVSVTVSAAEQPQRIRLTVRDSGIGIAQDKLGAIFSAFVQADGSTHRKYGGTGLGLAISRQLATLLGGEIQVESHIGQGSVFTLTLPCDSRDHLSPPVLPPLRAAAALAAENTSVCSDAGDTVSDPDVDDTSNCTDAHEPATAETPCRTILVIEHDPRFARSLQNVIHDAGFQCLLTATSEAGLAAARSQAVHAILLDHALPDRGSCDLLELLKQDERTRYLPVHVVSAPDQGSEAQDPSGMESVLTLSDRLQLLDMLRHLSPDPHPRRKRVLVVENDLHQRANVQQLLASEEVFISAVGTAQAALDALQNQTFDCMVMDLNLPDLSGYDLLERINARKGAFPPIIVYTGYSLTPEEEASLQRFSRSIIIKGARSPERLLAEVTLFLHQVGSHRLAAPHGLQSKQVRSREALLEGRRILVVEDDVRNIFALSAVLEPKGVKVEIARNGREAIETLDATQVDGSKPPIDLVLMDIMMPEMDGYEAMRAIRERSAFARLPIIALTAKAMPDDQEKCLAAGASDYIAKPLDVEKLMSLIRVWIRQ
jgi:signal transduction histidine kinase/DNA-binding response OmpR family regulator/CHASE3 domain sensor protein